MKNILYFLPLLSFSATAYCADLSGTITDVSSYQNGVVNVTATANINDASGSKLIVTAQSSGDAITSSTGDTNAFYVAGGSGNRTLTITSDVHIDAGAADGAFEMRYNNTLSIASSATLSTKGDFLVIGTGSNIKNYGSLYIDGDANIGAASTMLFGDTTITGSLNLNPLTTNYSTATPSSSIIFYEGSTLNISSNTINIVKSANNYNRYAMRVIDSDILSGITTSLNEGSGSAINTMTMAYIYFDSGSNSSVTASTTAMNGDGIGEQVNIGSFEFSNSSAVYIQLSSAKEVLNNSLSSDMKQQLVLIESLGFSSDFTSDTMSDTTASIVLADFANNLLQFEDFQDYTIYDITDSDFASLYLAIKNGDSDSYIKIETDANSVDGGYFEFSSDGYLNYVVPEPSTYAAILGALTLAFVIYRRRK